MSRQNPDLQILRGGEIDPIGSDPIQPLMAHTHTHPSVSFGEERANNNVVIAKK